jgi:hypothetical protein
MADGVPFMKVLALLEEHGWDFTGIWAPYRVFNKRDRLTILLEVHDKEVTLEAFENIKAIVERDQRAS